LWKISNGKFESHIILKRVIRRDRYWTSFRKDEAKKRKTLNHVVVKTRREL